MSSKDAKKDAKEKGKADSAKPAPPPPPKPQTPLEALHSHIALLEKFVDSRDARFFTRVLRHMNHVRSSLPTEQLRAAIQTYVLDAARATALVDLLAVVAAKRVAAAAAAPVSVRRMEWVASRVMVSSFWCPLL
jgi:hypothetical protein